MIVYVQKNGELACKATDSRSAADILKWYEIHLLIQNSVFISETFASYLESTVKSSWTWSALLFKKASQTCRKSLKSEAGFSSLFEIQQQDRKTNRKKREKSENTKINKKQRRRITIQNKMKQRKSVINTDLKYAFTRPDYKIF